MVFCTFESLGDRLLLTLLITNWLNFVWSDTINVLY